MCAMINELSQCQEDSSCYFSGYFMSIHNL